MRFILTMVPMSIWIFCNVSYAQPPPFRSVTITGKISGDYNKVCLFEKGSSKIPFKTVYLSGRHRTYRMDIGIPSDMKKKGDYYYTDMRFWGDKNKNGIRDQGEPISQCHFIIWIPSANVVFMQVYKGPKYRFVSPTLQYDYR